MEFVPTDKKPKETEPSALPGAQPLLVSLVLARDATALEEEITRFGALLAAVGLLTVGVTACVLRIVILSCLKPLRRLADQIGGIGEADLSARIGIDDEPSELQPVRARLNDLLSRLEAAFRRERTLSANLAHELRTPLAGLRTTMEVAVSKPRLPGEYEEAIDECLEITRQVQGMVEKLLSLFRLEGGRRPAGMDEVPLDDLVKSSWEAMASAAAEAKQLQVRWSLRAPRPLITDRDLLGLAVRNILENAAAYTGAGGWIAIETAVEGGAAKLRVANSGCTLRPEDAERVFDRFWRGDSVRSDAGVHCGLGLSLVRKVLEALGGSAEVRTVDGGEFEITLSIPAREGAEAAKLAAR
jgi:signal transduction histidine kinase